MVARTHLGASVAGVASLLIVAALGITPVRQSQAEVYIADELRFDLPMDRRIEVPAGRYVRIPLPVKSPAILDVEVAVQNAVFKDLNVYVCDETSLQRFAQRLPSDCRGVNKGRGVIRFRHIIQASQPHYLLLDNTYAMMIKKKAAAHVVATVRLPPDELNQFRTVFEKIPQYISEKFAVPEFDLRLEPCGQENAFSRSKGGHITFCSELFFGLLAKNMKGAFLAILFHEVGHTLLNLWGLPNWDNEETADEFALVMLFWEGNQQSALDWISYFSKDDSRAQAAYQIRQGDRHPLSVQRIRNIRRVLKNPRPVIQRWNRLVYPHLSEEGLRKIIDNPGHYSDRELAQQELARRTR